MRTEEYKIVHEDGCPWREREESLCLCVKEKLVELFSILEELKDENMRLINKVENKKKIKGLEKHPDIC